MKFIFFLVLYLALFLSGCSKYFFLSKSEKAHLETVFRQKHEMLNQIKLSSRELNVCRLRIAEPIVEDTVESLQESSDSSSSQFECASVVERTNSLIIEAKNRFINIEEIDQALLDGRDLAEKEQGLKR